uniref:Uncharacterized protein n=1 Tax=Archaeoglobus fulgidus TaxID=2234 RepID=A0A7C3RCI1_ARCFL
MGRAPLIPLFCLLFFALASFAAAYEFDYSCSKTFKGYYFGSEYHYFTCTVTPKSPKLADDQEYHVETQLDSSAVVAVVEYVDGKKLLFPTPRDYYSSDTVTRLKFFVPESYDGVKEISLTVSGYIPVIASRLENLTILKMEAEKELLKLQITVVNRQKFYSDIRYFEEAECADQKKLKEAKMLYNAEKYIEAEELMKDIENAVEECYVSSRMETYRARIYELKSLLTEISRDLILIQYRLEKDRIENYEDVKARYDELQKKFRSIDEEMDELEILVREGKFTAADTRIVQIESSLSSLKQEVEEFKKSIREKSLIEADLIIIAVISLIAIAAALIAISRRRKDKW